MKKLLSWVLCAVLIASLFAFCEELPMYERIEMNDTLETLTERYGGPVLTEDGYADFGGVLCAFFESGRLRAKIVSFDAISEAASFTDSDFSGARNLKKGAPEEEVNALFGGAGAEIMRINLSDEENSGVQRVDAWVNADGNAVQALFELEDGKWVLFAIVETNGGALSNER